jgi:hypothetical protein
MMAESTNNAAATATFDLAAIYQTFRERPSQPARLVGRVLAAAKLARLSVQVLINDDSGEQPELWQRALRPRVDVYVRSPNVHEVRAYNRLASLTNASLLAFLQGDECLPETAGALSWLAEAHTLFARLPRLAVLGGHAGFLDPGTQTTDLGYAFGPYPRRPPIRSYLARGAAGPAREQPYDAASTAPLPFMHVPMVNIGPYFVRTAAFHALGGFTSAWGAAGEPGGHFDGEMSLRCWLAAPEHWSVGLYYAGVGNGVGGHKTRIVRLAAGRRAHLTPPHWQHMHGTLARKHRTLHAGSTARTDAWDPRNKLHGKAASGAPHAP